MKNASGSFQPSQPAIATRAIPARIIRYALSLIFLLVGPAAFSQRAYEVVHQFGVADGSTPVGNMVIDSSGNLYGVTMAGGTNSFCDYRTGCGTVFKLSKTSTGAWQETVLHRFTDGSDGGQPQDGLAIDGAGNLFGTTSAGGSGAGTVFEVSPTATSEWKETVIYAFQNQADGGEPYGKVTLDAAGNLYGTTPNFGAYGYGNVFRLSPAPGGGWTFTVLYSFTGPSDGGSLGGLILDAAGNLYGAGGSAVYELSPTASGEWTEIILHTFNQTDGAFPVGALLFDAAGNLYGTTQRGGDLTGCGSWGCGVVYRLSPNSSGGWTETVLITFPPGASGNGGAAGANPVAGLILHGALHGALHGGDLYGTTYAGGRWSHGVVFKLAPDSSGAWHETIVHTFDADVAHGLGPWAPVIFDASGDLLGTTAGGGNLTGSGVVFELTP
ncbi:MAG TPA: choice-of-anchor tandem repeat GloVer-containing protein [Candidatus Sulfotelmatobacter sp.]